MSTVSKKTQLFHQLRALGAAHPYFSLDAVRDMVAADGLELSADLLREYLSAAMQRGVIHDAGRGWYSSLPTPATLAPEPVAKLRDALTGRFPLMPFYVWSTQQVNPWMHHLLGKFVRFVYADRDDVDDLAAFLRAEGWAVVVNPTAKNAADIIPGDRCVVVRGTRRNIDPDGEPRVVTILIDLMLENDKLGLMDNDERREMTRRLMTSNRVELAALLSRLHDHKRTLADLTGSADQPIIAEYGPGSELIGRCAP